MQINTVDGIQKLLIWKNTTLNIAVNFTGIYVIAQ